MIKHVVMWKMKPYAEGADGATNAAKVKALLDSCRDLVPGMLAWEVALAQPGLEATHDVVLYSAFADAAALDAYQNHPTHVAMKGFIGAVRAERQCFDWRSEATEQTGTVA